MNSSITKHFSKSNTRGTVLESIVFSKNGSIKEYWIRMSNKVSPETLSLAFYCWDIKELDNNCYYITTPLTIEKGMTI